MLPKALTIPRERSPLSSAILSRLEHLDLSGNVTEISKHATALGGFSEIFHGRCLISGRGEVEVAIKRLRFHAQSSDWKKLFDQEIYVWAKISHPNVLPLLGFAICNDTGFPLLISEWMPLGSASKYLRDFPDTTIMEIAQMAYDVASGLAYLHEIEVIHSDVKADNIVISHDRKALLCDLGCARKNDASRSMGRPSLTTKGTYTFWAPELVECDASGLQSKKTDVWAFGMTVFELICREVPYKGLNGIQVLHAITVGAPPQFPLVVMGIQSKEDQLVRESLQSVCRMCWIVNPEKRSTIQVIKEKLKSIVATRLAADEEHAPGSGQACDPITALSSIVKHNPVAEAETARAGLLQESWKIVIPTASSKSDPRKISQNKEDSDKLEISNLPHVETSLTVVEPIHGLEKASIQGYRVASQQCETRAKETNSEHEETDGK